MKISSSSKPTRRLRRYILCRGRQAALTVPIGLVLLTISTGQALAADCPKGMSQIDCSALLNNWVDWVPGVNTCVQANTTLEGYTLPASSGRTGDEQPINDQGYVTDDQGNVNGGRVTFWQFASKGQAYRDYYIAMRWNYVKWNWDGTSTDLDNSQLQWMQKEPRLLIVTDKNTGKSIIAVAMDAGPAPWTGVDTQSNNDPKEGWQNPQAGTPNEYKGRVSGLPPAAISALGAKQGMQDGSGDILTYGWAPDQTATPGPTQTPSGATNTAACAGGVGPGNVVWYSQRDSRWANESVYCGTYGDCGCYLTALAMIVSTITGQKVLPDQIVSQTGGHSDVYGTADHYHMSVQSYSVSDLVDATKKLDAHHLILVHGSYGDPFYDGSTHWEVIRGVAPDGNILIDDPWDLPDPDNPSVPSKTAGSIEYPKNSGVWQSTSAQTYKEWPINDFYAHASEVYVYGYPAS